MLFYSCFFFFNDTATTEIYTLSLHDALPISPVPTSGSIAGPGISCGAGAIGDCAESVASGTSVVLSDSPATGYQLGAWSGCQSVSGAQCTVQMTQERTVAETSTPLVYTLPVSPVPTHG